MVEEEPKQMQNPWVNNRDTNSEHHQPSRVEFDGRCVSLVSESMEVSHGAEASRSTPKPPDDKKKSDGNLGFPERAFSAAGAAFLSAILVNPLDVAKVIIHEPTFIFKVILILLVLVDLYSCGWIIAELSFCPLQTRLQAQAAGVPYSHPLSNIISRMAFFGPNMVWKSFNFPFLLVT